MIEPVHFPNEGSFSGLIQWVQYQNSWSCCGSVFTPPVPWNAILGTSWRIPVSRWDHPLFARTFLPGVSFWTRIKLNLTFWPETVSACRAIHISSCCQQYSHIFNFKLDPSRYPDLTRLNRWETARYYIYICVLFRIEIWIYEQDSEVFRDQISTFFLQRPAIRSRRFAMLSWSKFLWRLLYKSQTNGKPQTFQCDDLGCDTRVHSVVHILPYLMQHSHWLSGMHQNFFAVASFASAGKCPRAPLSSVAPSRACFLPRCSSIPSPPPPLNKGKFIENTHTHTHMCVFSMFLYFVLNFFRSKRVYVFLGSVLGLKCFDVPWHFFASCVFSFWVLRFCIPERKHKSTCMAHATHLKTSSAPAAHQLRKLVWKTCGQNTWSRFLGFRPSFRSRQHGKLGWQPQNRLDVC